VCHLVHDRDAIRMTVGVEYAVHMMVLPWPHIAIPRGILGHSFRKANGFKQVVECQGMVARRLVSASDEA